MSVFVYNVWIVGIDNTQYWYTQCDSSEAAEKRAQEFRRITPKDKYKKVHITFTAKENANADIRKEWGH